MQLYEQQYSASPPCGAAWYAALNIALAIGSINDAFGKRGASPESVSLDEASPWSFAGYFRNSCSVLTELMFTSHNILAVQALLGIVGYLQIPLIHQISNSREVLCFGGFTRH
jgi:hypothetical protein